MCLVINYYSWEMFWSLLQRCFDFNQVWTPCGLFRVIRLTWEFTIHHLSVSPPCHPYLNSSTPVNHRSSQIKHFRYHRNVTIETVKYHLVLFNYYSASQVSTWQRIPFILGWIWFVNTFCTGRKTLVLSWFKLVAQGFGTNAHIQRLLHTLHVWKVP